MSQTNNQTKTEERESFWKLVEEIQTQALDDHNKGLNDYDELIFDVIEELGSSLSSRNVWEKVKELAEEVLENATLTD